MGTMMRLTLVAVLLFVLIPNHALASGPVITGTLVGVIEDQDPLTGQAVTRTITMTIVFSQPIYVISPYAYTDTFSTGSEFALDRSGTLGDIAAGAGSLMLFFYFIYHKAREVVRKNGNAQ